MTTNRPMKGMVDSRSFNRVDLACASASALLWLAWPGLGWLPLLLACAPWALRLGSGAVQPRRFLFRRTPFDLSLAVFLLTAGAGVWAAYDQEKAWAKFWILVASVLLFYALARQDRASLWVFAALLGAAGMLAAVYFLLTNDWQAQPAKIALFNQVGRWWMEVRPAFQALPIHPNNAASLMGVLLPFALACGLAAWRARRVWAALLALLAAGLTGLGLLLTSSRGAVLSLALILGLSCLGWLPGRLSGWLSRRYSGPRWSLFVLLGIPLLFLGLGLSWLPNGGILRLLDSLPGPASASSRADIANNTLQLVADFPYTGGGLGAFPGLYSQYILVIPYYFIEYSHNLFLEIAVSQGVLGLLAFTAILAGSAWLLASALKAQPTWLAWAALASLAFMCLHGLVTDAIYGERGSPLVFMHAGMALAIAHPLAAQNSRQEAAPGTARGLGRAAWKLGGAGAALLILLAAAALMAALYSFRQPLLAGWYANLGAVEMARVELADFPAQEWDDGKSAALLEPAAALFEKSLAIQPGNRTANHRLGLIAGLRRDYSTAVRYLEAAQRVSPRHRGIQKALGYAYAWTGRFDRAAELLGPLPEAGEELEVYAWWWRTQGREDLARNAGTAAENLAARSR